LYLTARDQISFQIESRKVKMTNPIEDRRKIPIIRIPFLILACAVTLSACTTATGLQDFNTRTINSPKAQTSKTEMVQYRMESSINALRKISNLRPVRLDTRLNAAAERHARDMSIQDRPWHFGSDGSSPNQRILQSGYRGQLVGETISESYESDQETLAAWMSEESARKVILSSEAKRIGVSWYKEPNGKTWRVLIMGK
jgi:uncharacterized protein YkwD